MSDAKIGDELTTTLLNYHVPRTVFGPGSGIAATQTPFGQAIVRTRPRPIFATLYGAGPAYTFAQAIQSAAGGWVAGPLAGTAREVNGKAGLAGKVVRAYPDPFGSYRFQWVARGKAAPPPAGTPACGSCIVSDTQLHATLQLSRCKMGTPFPNGPNIQGPDSGNMATLNFALKLDAPFAPASLSDYVSNYGFLSDYQPVVDYLCFSSTQIKPGDYLQIATDCTHVRIQAFTKTANGYSPSQSAINASGNYANFAIALQNCTPPHWYGETRDGLGGLMVACDVTR